MPTVTWLVEFDWANTGAYAANEAARTVALRVERGGGERFAPQPAGKAVITLENADRRFDPWYTASPLYPNVMPHRGVRIRAVYGGTTYPIFAGKIEDIEPAPQAGKRRVVVTAYDGLRDLAEADAAVALQEGITIDQALDLVLDDAGWPAGASYRDIDPSHDVLAYWWLNSDAKARAEIDKLVQSEHGAFFVAADGKATFVGRRGYTTGEASGALDEDHITDISLVNPWEAVYNDVQVVCQPVTIEPLAVIWKLVDTNVYLAPGETVEVWAQYKDAAGSQCAAAEIVTPVATTDYTANSRPDGSGTDATADLSVSADIYATWAKLTLANGGTAGLYVTLCQLRGQALSQEQTTVRAQDASSQATYGRRRLPIATPWLQRVAGAKDLADGLVNNFASPRPPATVELKNRLPTMLDYELFDRLSFTAPSYGLSQLMQVGKLELATGQTMQELTLTLTLEPAESQVSWLLGIVGQGELGVTTWCGY